MNNLVYLLPLRYPTEKAYAITIGNTLSCMPASEFSTEIWCESNAYSDEFKNKIVPFSLPRPYSKKFSFGNRVLGLFIFYLRLIVFAGKTKSKFKSRKDVNFVWTRHPLTLIFIYKSRKVSKILIEFHQSPNFLDRLLTRLYSTKKSVEVIGITEKSVQELKELFPGAQVEKAEMGVPGVHVLDQGALLPSQIRIGYVGKGTSSGNDNNLKILIQGFSLLRRPCVTLEFVGLEQKIKEQLNEMSKMLEIPEERISFVDHIPHEKVKNVIAGLSIGVIPYEWNEYNSHRFPIKLVEYAAAGLWILVDEGFADGLCLSEKMVVRYKTGNPQDFADKLESLCSKISSNPARNEFAINFAKDRTYSKRAELIAKELLCQTKV